jgi:hypothetical protein
MSETKALSVSFALTLPPEDSGRKSLEAVIFAPSNYVQVWTRESWDLESGQGESAWVLVTHHDSTWRQSLEGILNKWKPVGFSNHIKWFKVVDPRSFLPKP